MSGRRRNWIVVLDIIDDDHYEYGPYTEAAAEKAVDRVRRWIDEQDDENYGEMHVGAYPIHHWGRDDETNGPEL